MQFDFDKVIDRGPASGSHSFKWEGYEERYPGFAIDAAHSLSMWVADMDFETPETVRDALRKRIEHGIFGYTSDAGTDEYRDAAIAWFARRYGWDGCERDWMLFSPGVVPVIYASVQAFTDEGDGVIVQPPVYYPFLTAITDNDRKIVSNPLIERDLHYSMDYEGLEALAKDPANKLAVFCSPHNPVGRVWTEDELVRAFQICADNDVIIVCDEIHADLIMPGCTFFTAGKLEQFHNRLILAHSASKTFNLAGLTSALATVPDAGLREALAAQYARNRMPHGNTFGLIAGAAAYRTGDEFADEAMRYISGNFAAVDAWLADNLPAVKIAPAEGTYLAWLDFRGLGLDEDTLYHRVIEGARVIGDLGAWFGEEGAGFMRFNFACPHARIEEFLERLGNEFLG